MKKEITGWEKMKQDGMALNFPLWIVLGLAFHFIFHKAWFKSFFMSAVFVMLIAMFFEFGQNKKGLERVKKWIDEKKMKQMQKIARMQMEKINQEAKKPR